MRLRLLPFLLILLVAQAPAAQAQPSSISTEMGMLQVDVVADGLNNVWGMAFLPNSDMLVTERDGRLRLIQNGQLLDDPISGTPTVFAVGQGGLLDVALHPDFASNNLVYLTYTKETDGNSTTAVARGKLDGMALLDIEDIFVANSQGRGHYGSRLVFDDQGYLFVSVGDRHANPRNDQANHPSQDITNHHGTVNRLHDDGRIPADNPFVDVAGAEPSIWSYGHRNPQGMVFDSATGRLWINEHGPQGGDELNLVLPGLNYGWPVIGYGVNYGGADLHETSAKDGMVLPAHYWVPSIATSGLLIYSGDLIPAWTGNFFVGGLKGQQVARLTMDGETVISEETLYQGNGRIRDIRQGPDGAIYLGIDGDADVPGIVRLRPIDAR